MYNIPMQVAMAKTSRHDVTLNELYERLSKLTTHIHNDNTYGTDFPVTLRLIQLSSIQTLIDDITQCVTELGHGQ